MQCILLLVIIEMSCLVTHAKNANQYPSYILLEVTQKQHTSEQKQANDEHAEQEHLAQEAIWEWSIKHIANIIDQSTQCEKHTHSHPPQPRP